MRYNEVMCATTGKRMRRCGCDKCKAMRKEVDEAATRGAERVCEEIRKNDRR